MGIGERDVGRGRGVEHGQEHDEQPEQAEQAQLDHMRLLAMRKRQVRRKAARAAQSGAQIPTSGGAALGSDIRTRMEPQLGADLSHVRVFTSGDSAAAADKLGARAFTTGNDVHFGVGEFAPGTKEGDRLIAHELTHAVQAQKSGVQRKASGDVHADSDNEHDVSRPGEPAEQEADAVADAATENLHGGNAKKVEGAGKQAAPAIGAKLSGRKIFRSKKDDKKDDKGGGATKNMSLLGAKGTQCTSKTMWKGKGKERIDVENPNPGQRAGQIHYQDNDDNKYLYDVASKTFSGAPKSVNAKLSDPSFKAGIDKALTLLGEKP